MQVEVAETGPCSRKLTIQIPPASVQEHLDAMYASAARQVQLKGFRPGKVPRKLLEKQYGPEILREAKEQLVNRSFSEACRQKELSPVGRVRIDEFEKLEVRLGSTFEFRVELDVRPKFDLQEVKGLRADPYETTATAADVDNALLEIANQKRSIKPVATPAQDGDFVKVDLLFLDEQGERVHERKGVQLNTRIPVAGTDPAAFAKALQGATAGQAIELAVTFPPNFEKDAFRGKQGKAVLQVHEVLRVQAAPVDDALAKSLDFDSLGALRADLETRIGQEKVRNGKLRQEEQCLQQLLDRHDFPLPGSLVEDQEQASLASFRERLKQSGMADEEIEKKLAESKDEAQQDARRRVRLFFLIEAIARQQKLFVTENDVEGELRNLAAANNATPEQVREYLEKNNQLGDLRLGLLERKVREFLRESAKIVDKKGN
jgi:trigger factor